MNEENERAMFSFLAMNMPMYDFLWTMCMNRFNQGAVIGNWIKLNMDNKFFDAEIKLTLKRKPTHKDKQLLIEHQGLDLDKIAESLK